MDQSAANRRHNIGFSAGTGGFSKKECSRGHDFIVPAPPTMIQAARGRDR
jgi:hypothetical protein